MTKPLSFSLRYHESNNSKPRDYTFPTGLHIIYGESNVGKSELIKVLSNSNQHKSSVFEIANINYKNDVKVIQQNPDLQIISNTVKNELAFNLECYSNDSEKISQHLDKLINELLFSADINRHPVTLSGGEKEILNITTTLSLKSKVILIDDALSFLSDHAKDSVVKYMLSKCAEKCVILWFTSDRNDFKYSISNWEMTSTKLVTASNLITTDLPHTALPNGQFNLEINNINFSYNSNRLLFNNFSRAVSNFRCLGITGDNGSGKSTLASLLLGLEKTNSGTILLQQHSKENIKIGYLDQFPEKLLGIMTLQQFADLLISSGILNHVKIDAIEDMLLTNRIVWKDIKEQLAIDIAWTILRFIVIVILTNCNYDILILDEPTFGMGSKQKNALYSYFIRYLAEKHLILISHDNRFINSLCDSKINL